MFNLGVIVPQSYFLPRLSRDLPIACKMGIENASQHINLILEPGNYNEDIDVLRQKVQGMIMRENLHGLICPLNPSLIGPLSELCAAEEIILIANTMGEDVFFESQLNDSLLVNSYQLWQTAWLTGLYTANLGFKNSVAIYGRHDGGYGIPLALAVGAEAGGANIKVTKITHMENENDACVDLLKEVERMEPDAILAHHSGKQAVNFLSDASTAKLTTPLITLSPFVETVDLDQFCSKIEGINTVSTYQRDADQYLRFVSEFNAKSQSVVHPHIIMAYESVSLLALGLEAAENSAYSTVLKTLKKISIEGPRGNVCLNPDFNESLSTAYIRAVSRTESGELFNKTIDTLEVPQLCHEQYQLAQKNTQKQGWVNPYLIA